MKYFILTVSLLPAFSAHAFNCTRAVNPSSIVLFLDTRNSTAEIESAARAACSRGETFKRMPSPGQTINQASLTRELSALAGQNKAVTSMVISGHNGGGAIHGDAGHGIDKFEAIQSFKSAYRNKPALLNQFQSVYLWGCWTNGPGEVAVWRSQLPSLKMISGFIDMAPINTAEASHTILGGLLERESSLLAESNRNSLRRSLSLIENINQTYASVYIESCNENLMYYIKNNYRDDSLNPSSPYSGGTHFLNYDQNFSCTELAPQIRANKELFMQYYLGQIPVPADTANGPLRQLYSFARNTSQCTDSMWEMNGDRLLMMTFFDNVKKNFAKTFAPEVVSAADEYRKIIDEMNSPSLVNLWNLPVMSNLKAYMNAGGSKIFRPDAATLQGKSRMQIRQMIMQLDGISKHAAMSVPGVARKFANLKVLQRKMETYLYQMNPRCMDFLEWHDYDPTYAPSPACGYNN